jgi:hypothetical protein
MSSFKRALTLAVVACAAAPAAATAASAERVALKSAPDGATAHCVRGSCTVIYRQADQLCVMTVKVKRATRRARARAAVVGGPTCGEFVLGDPRPDQP